MIWWLYYSPKFNGFFVLRYISPGFNPRNLSRTWITSHYCYRVTFSIFLIFIISPPPSSRPVAAISKKLGSTFFEINLQCLEKCYDGLIGLHKVFCDIDSIENLWLGSLLWKNLVRGWGQIWNMERSTQKRTEQKLWMTTLKESEVIWSV